MAKKLSLEERKVIALEKIAVALGDESDSPLVRAANALELIERRLVTENSSGEEFSLARCVFLIE